MIGPFEADNDATPLTPEEIKALIPTHVALRSELNELEQKNIGEADGWAFSRNRDVADESFLKGLHNRMFNNIWRWAGEYRKSERNLGVKPYLIETEMRKLLDDVRYWIEHDTYDADELAVRFHHRLVSVHPFPNGNGRWSRLAGDLMAVQLGSPRFSWGSANLHARGDVRQSYIDALHSADGHDLGLLVKFARS